jgi:hypothetical protein
MCTDPAVPWLRRVAFAPAVVAFGALAACGGGSTDAAGGADEVTSLEDGSSSGAGVDASAEDATLAADEAALEFSQCLRDEGLDVPDIGVDTNGNIALRDAFEQVDRSDAAFGDAMDACSDLHAGAGFGGGPGAGRDSTECRDALVELSDCVRDAGFDGMWTSSRPDRRDLALV